MANPVEPLRIQKGTPMPSPTKMAGRALTELSPMERRRNSPSFNQTTKKQLLDSSPLETSPFSAKFNASFGTGNTQSPRAYWHSREPASPTRSGVENRETRETSPSGFKRPSIENLKRASRVKNSTMFTKEAKQEYDPASAPVIERPLAAGRPLAAASPYQTTQESRQDGSLLDRINNTSFCSPDGGVKTNQQSPGKSSLSKNSRYGHAFDPENGIWSEDDDSFNDRQLPPGKTLHRHAKSVTFDVKPPQINEYEMTTPDPSSVASGSREGSYDSAEDDEDESFEQGSFAGPEESFDASLEDTEKTPVVLPEDWRFMSPDAVNDDLTARMDDPFGEERATPPFSAQPVLSERDRSPKRTDSVNSSGDKRPLPPLPPSRLSPSPSHQVEGDSGLFAAAERATAAHRSMPSTPKAASVSKSELQAMTGSSMPLEDRLRLMMIQDNEKAQSPRSYAEEQRERRLRRGNNHEKSPDRTLQSSPKHEEAAEPPRISRESILRKIQLMQDEHEIDPDTPLPSLGERSFHYADESVIIKQEETELEIDLQSIPVQIAGQGLEHKPSESDIEPATDDDGESHYSTDLKPQTGLYEEAISQQAQEASQAIAALPATTEAKDASRNHRLSFPQFSTTLNSDDFGLSFSNYMTPMSSINEPVKQQMSLDAVSSQAARFERPQTPLNPSNLYDGTGYGDDADYESSHTPESVIHRSVSPISEPEVEPEPIPEPVATIKAPGGKLKTRASLAPADVQAMAETRRQVSGERPRVPPIPERAHNRPSVIPEADSFMPENSFEEPNVPEISKEGHRKSSLMPLDVSTQEVDEELSMGIDKEFDRRIEAQKKGYLMRQNTKVVVASSASKETVEGPEAEDPLARGTRSAGNSPVKRNTSSTWTTEPWNGKVRRKSIRQSAGSPMKKAASGVAPPMPGMPSNVSSGLDAVAEDEIMPEIDEFDQNGERGRLFVKVVGVKNLEMPLPRNERTYFALTLDNGLHCVTTTWLELGKTAPIGQEFELVVLNDLEFQLTLSTKLEPPKSPIVESPTKKTAKASALSRVFTSPKKRKEMEMKEKEEAQRAAKQRENEARERRLNPTAWDLLHNVVGTDGSFARAYISLKEHEDEAFGRPFTVDVPCFNEWTVDEARSISSAKNGRNAAPANPLRKAPYKIGKLELQLLYVPKPKEATDEDMPKSMNGCVRELAEAEKAKNVSFEGHLSQQGGDCPYWRRRLFRLEGSKLTAYHESTHQPRATINLAKAVKLIDDKSSLMAKEVSGKGGSRRKSAFAEEEEGYMFVEEGFRVRFANGEVIDFYADSTAEKEKWMQSLSEVVGKDTKKSKSWTDIVLKREKLLASKLNKSAMPPSSSAKSAPPTPAKPEKTSTTTTTTAGRPSFTRPLSQQEVARPSSQQARSRITGNDKPLPKPGANARLSAAAERRAKTRSMIF